jgi:hypothetical protein
MENCTLRYELEDLVCNLKERTLQMHNYNLQVLQIEVHIQPFAMLAQNTFVGADNQLGCLPVWVCSRLWMHIDIGTAEIWYCVRRTTSKERRHQSAKATCMLPALGDVPKHWCTLSFETLSCYIIAGERFDRAKFKYLQEGGVYAS